MNALRWAIGTLLVSIRLEKWGLLGILSTYMASLLALGFMGEKPLQWKVSNFITYWSVCMCFMSFVGYFRIRRTLAILEKRMDIEKHLFNISIRGENVGKAQRHAEKHKDLLQSLHSGDFLTWE